MSREQRLHLVALTAENALWHQREYQRTGDRYHLGQWKAYARVAFRLRHLEDESADG